MNAYYYARCPLCGALAIETTLEKLRNELSIHTDVEHPKTAESPATMDLLRAAMEEAGYYPGSKASEEPTGTEVHYACPHCNVVLSATSMDQLKTEAIGHMFAKHSGSDNAVAKMERDLIDAFNKYVPHHCSEKEPTATQGSGLSQTGQATQVSMGYFKSVCHLCAHEIRGKTAVDFEANVRHHVASVHFRPSAPKYKDAVQKILDDQLFIFESDPKDALAPKPPLTYVIPDFEDQRKPTPKPPIGIEPEHIWRETRMFALIACINRYQAAGFPVKDDWMAELDRYLSLWCAPKYAAKYAGSKRGFGQPPFHDGDTPLSTKETK